MLYSEMSNVGCYINVGNTQVSNGCIAVDNIFVRSTVYAQTLTIGSTTITESQLQQLLALLN